MGCCPRPALPAARAALEPDGVTRTFHFPVDPQALDYGGSGALVTQLAALEAAPALLNAPGPQPRVTSQLTQLLPQARERVAATWSQVNVVLAGLACAAVLVILVAAELLARRRSVALRTVRARGATLVGIAGRAGAESAVVVGLGTAVGVTLGVVVAPGAVTWLWVVVVVIAGVLAPPAFATLTAARSETRRVPTDRHHRRRVQRVRTVRRVSFEVALVVLAVAALATLRRRGAASISGPTDQVLAAAPVLVAVAGALLLWRALPPLLGGALRFARRSRRAGPLLAVARARSTGSPLAFVALVVVVTLAALCGALAGTARVGQVDGSWDNVGADALVQTRCRTRRCRPSRTGWPGPTASTRWPSAGCRPEARSSACPASTRCGCSRWTPRRTARCLPGLRSGPLRSSRCWPTRPAPQRPAPSPVRCPRWCPARCWAPGRRCAGAT